MRRRTVFFALAFALGTLFGYAVNGIQRAAQARLVASSKKAADPAVGVRKLGKKLKLSHKQSVAIANIVGSRQRDIQELKSEFRPKYAALRETMKQEIRTVLDEQQKMRFQTMTEQAEKNYPWMREIPAQRDDSSRPEEEQSGSDDSKT